tara:strand:- start:7721 stop:9289 length:1569 start_codon:yes stop_codon:yes gene_type:complete
MSYKNPRIIDDKSGLIVSQAMEKASGTLAQGIAVFGAEEKRREEVLKKENERRNDIYIGLANEMSIDATEFNAKLKEGPEKLRNFMIPNTQSFLEQINSIDIDQQINKNKDPMLSKRRANLVQQLADANTFAESYITTASNARELYSNDPNAFQTGRYTFREFDGTASKAQASTIFNAIGGIPKYSIDFSKGENNKFNVTVTGDDQTFTMTQEEFLNKSNNLVIKKETNAAVVQSELLNTQLYNADGGANTKVREGKSSVETYKDGNLEFTVNRQMLNTAEVDAVNFKSQLDMVSYIDSFIDKQEQALYLEDLNIDPKEYQDNKDKRADLIKTAQIGLFKADSGVKERIIKGGEGEDDLIEYYIDTPIGNPTKITPDSLDRVEEDRIKTINIINKGWDTVTADTTFSSLTDKSRAEFIVQSLPALRGKLSNRGDYGLTSDANGNLVMPSGEVDAAFMAALSAAESKKRKEDNTPDEMLPGKTIDITSGNTSQNIATLTELLRLNYSLDYVQAERQARIFLKK